ncbi:MAG: Nif11-like leader peptide family natural product precursor, partial [Clostridia bacterium]|nr:Nif11-like leader peptide family natural product precursor [Clostridia bacterium]
MATEKVKIFLERLQADPEAKKLYEGRTKPTTGEEFVRVCAQIASKLGYDLTEADIREAITEAEQARREKTAAEIQKLPDEEVVKATGGEEDVFWTGEKAPDGHEMGCFAIYYSYAWQRDHDIWCRHEY